MPTSLLALNGELYGTTLFGGGAGCASGFGCGTVFHLSKSGVLSVVYTFKGGRDGSGPYSLIAWNGALYGTTGGGGGGDCPKFGCGTVFEVTPQGLEKVIYAFKGGADGYGPVSLLAFQGALYGATNHGGGTGCGADLGCGTLFKLTPDGTETVLHIFKDDHGGDGPGDLIEMNGVFYGTATDLVFTFTPQGAERTVYAFHGGNDGQYASGLTSLDGVLYGTTGAGGGTGCGDAGCGTIYRLTSSGAETVIYAFKGGDDGESPVGLVNLNGTLYGTTAKQQGWGGTLFRVTPCGVKTVIATFKSDRNWAAPTADLVDIGGRLYGFTQQGGQAQAGSIFSVAP